MKTRMTGGIIAAVSGVMLCGSAAMAIEMKPALTLDMAKKMAAACEAKATQEKWKMNIAVVDDGANLVFFQHMDDAFKGSIYISQHKAMTSANFPFPTRVFGELAFGKDGKPGMVPGIADVPGDHHLRRGLADHDRKQGPDRRHRRQRRHLRPGRGVREGRPRSSSGRFEVALTESHEAAQGNPNLRELGIPCAAGATMRCRGAAPAYVVSLGGGNKKYTHGTIVAQSRAYFAVRLRRRLIQICHRAARV